MTREEALESLSSEFKAQMDALNSKGLVDLKPLNGGVGDVSSHEYVWTLNNALKVCDDDDVETYDAAAFDEALKKFRI